MRTGYRASGYACENSSGNEPCASLGRTHDRRSPDIPAWHRTARAIVAALMDRMLGLKRSHIQTFTSRSFVTLMCADHPLELLACRGFRIISGGPISRLEDYAWWYQMNRWVGRMFHHFAPKSNLYSARAIPLMH